MKRLSLNPDPHSAIAAKQRAVAQEHQERALLAALKEKYKE